MWPFDAFDPGYFAMHTALPIGLVLLGVAALIFVPGKVLKVVIFLGCIISAVWLGGWLR
jgi:hypothetical protein